MGVISLAGVWKSWGRQPALRGVDLALAPGRVVGLLGPNGAGKSTAIQLVLGWTRPDRGTVELFGRPPDDAGRARVGWVPEQRALPTRARLLETLVLHGRLRGRSSMETHERARRWIGELRLDGREHTAIGDLSNGQQQRAQIAIALMGAPDVLLLDEPLTALDPEHQAHVTGILRGLAAEGVAVLVATHRLREAEAFVDHVVLIADGRVRVHASLSEVLAPSGAVWRVRSDQDGWIAGPGVRSVAREGDAHRVELAPDAELADLLRRASDAGARITSIEAVRPSLHDVYLRAVA